MQNKGAIRLFAIAFAVVCLYQLSFTWVASRVEKKAAEFANNYVKKQFPDKIAATDEITKAFIEAEKLKKENHFIDSISGEVVYNLGIKKYTFKECRERTINLGLDLKGGMNVILEVNVIDIIRSLSNFSTDTTFLKAIDRAKELQKNSQDDFVTLFGKAFEQIDPNAKLASIFSLPMEMKGKVDFNSSNSQVLAVLTKETNDAIDNSFNILSTRINKFGVVQPNIQQLGTKGRILVELPGIKEPERVRKLLQGTANLEFWETYENSEIYPSLVEANKKIKELKAAEVITVDSITPKVIAETKAEVKDTAKSGLALLEKIEKDSTKLGSDSASLPGNAIKEYPLFSILQPNARENQLAPGPVIGYASIKDTAQVNSYLSNPQVRSLFKNDVRFYWSAKPLKGDKTESIYELLVIKAKGLDGRPPLDGTAVTSARSEFGQNQAVATVSMTMNAEGSKTWARMTKDNIGRCIAIVLDNYVVSYPRVKQEISGNTQIEGDFTINEAGDLAIVLKSGKMPARAEIIQGAIVGPSLGEASVKAGLASFKIAFFVVLIYMIFYYNRAGWVANIALIVNAFFIFGILASLNAVLTLPGIAGIVLTLGMAVDANVIIYERIREELRAGKAIRTAVTDGYHHAYSAIIDGNVTTLLTGIVLFIFGSGPIQGFATTLIIGILTSLFTAIFISRLVFEGILSRNKDISFSNSITENVLVHANFDFIGKRKIFYSISGIIITLGIISMFTRGFSLGIDFTGGRTYIVKFDNSVKTGEIQKSLTGVFDGSIPEVKTFGTGGNQVKIATKFMNDEEQVKNIDKADIDSIVEGRLFTGLKPFIGDKSFDKFIADNLQSSEKVGPTIADDIQKGAVLAVFFALLIIFIYIFARFKNWQFGLGGIVSLTHDVLFVLGIYSLLWGYLPFSLEIDQSFIAAVLTVIGYSINDSVIIFDRIREYTHLFPKRSREDIYNAAMNSTLGRTLNTALTTLFTVIVIFVFGGEVIRGFIFALMIGIGVGTYSSVCNAAPVVFDTIIASERKKNKLKKA